MKTLISLILPALIAALTADCGSAGSGPVASADSPATVVGTVAPAITIHTITLVVDGNRLTLSDGDALPARPGSDVRVVEVEVSVGRMAANAGEVCVDFVPTLESGQEADAHRAGTHMVPLAPGLLTLPGPDGGWTVDEGWAGIAAVVNHWPGVETQDAGCAERKCERDHRLVLRFRSPRS